MRDHDDPDAMDISVPVLWAKKAGFLKYQAMKISPAAQFLIEEAMRGDAKQFCMFCAGRCKCGVSDEETLKSFQDDCRLDRRSEL